MRIYVYFLSLLMVIAPIYANAIGFLPAIGATIAGEVAVGVGKATIKKLPKETKRKMIKNATGLCAKSFLSFTFCSSMIEAMVGDGIEVEVNNNEINIYKKVEGNDCKQYAEYYSYYGHSQGQISDIPSGFFSSFDDLKRNILKGAKERYPNKKPTKIDDNNAMYTMEIARKNIQQYRQTHSLQDVEVPPGRFRNVSPNLISYAVFDDNDYFITHGYFYHDLLVLNADCNGGKRHLTDDEIEEYFDKHAKGDDITNIYNYDYSDNSITINGDKISGDEINRKKNDFDNDYEEKKLSKDATENMKKKKKDYDIEDINDENCDKNEFGEYDKCGSDRKKEKDLDEYCEKNPSEQLCQDRYKEKETDKHCEKNQNDAFCKARKDKKDKEKVEKQFCKDNPNHKSCKDKKDDDTDEEPKKDKPIDCKASSFHRKVCDWIDWTQGKYQEDKDTKIDIKDGSADFELNKNRIQFTAQCPPPKKINIHFNQINVNYEISYQGLCDAFITLKPFLLGLSGIHSAMIIAGRRD